MEEKNQGYRVTDLNYANFSSRIDFAPPPSLSQATNDETSTQFHHAATIVQAAQTDDQVTHSFEKQVRIRHQLSVVTHASLCRIRQELMGYTMV